MGSPNERSSRRQDLQGLMARLCAPDLTLDEAKTLRARLAEMLAEDSGAVEPPSPRPRDRRSA